MSVTTYPTRETYRPWALAVVAGTAAAVVVTWTNSDDVQRWFGPVPAVLGIPIAGLGGYGALRLLQARGFWRDSEKRWQPGAVPLAVLGSVPFAVVAIAVDLAFGFDEDMNVAWPASILFYPMVLIVAEVLFHLVPLAGAVLASRSSWSDLTFDAPSTAIIGTVALVEPVFQVVARSTLAVFVFPHVYLIGFVQLLLLRRYGYVAMVVFRLSYYLLWHVLWGALRLSILF